MIKTGDKVFCAGRWVSPQQFGNKSLFVVDVVSLLHSSTDWRALWTFAPNQHPPCNRPKAVERIPCPASVLGLFAWRSDGKLGTPERLRSEDRSHPRKQN